MSEWVTLCQPSCSAEAVETVISNSETINNIINEQNNITNTVTNQTTEIENIESVINEIEEIINRISTEDENQDELINNLASEITTLKSWNHQQEQIIKGMQNTVILDPIYNNFQEWCENVYIPQAYHIKNKYMEWDIYINTNESNAATNATYVCVRKPNATSDYSANDWQLVYRATPADMVTIIGIDPLEITHPYKHEWVINVNPERLADMLGQLRSLDLTKVEVALDKVYFEPTIKNSVTIQENLTVENKIECETLDVSHNAEITQLHVEEACIDNMICDTTVRGDIESHGDINIQNNLNVTNELWTGKLHIDWHVHLPDARQIKIWDVDLVEWIKLYVNTYGCINQKCP